MSFTPAYDAGLRARREVMGDERVDLELGQTTDLTRDFEEFVTTYAWGGVWNREALDQRSRVLVAITALVAGGHLDELDTHLHAARRAGVSREEIAEVLLQTAVYCGVPAARRAFELASQALDSDD